MTISSIMFRRGSEITPAMETLVGQPGMFLNSSVDPLMVDVLSQ